MKLKEFNAENTSSRVPSSPTLSINTKSGVFNFNISAVEMLGLSQGDAVQLLQDEEEPDNWFVEKLTGKDAGKGFTLRGKDEKYGLSFNNTTLARQIFESMDVDSLSGRGQLAKAATEVGKRKLYGIIHIATSPTRNNADN